MENNQQILQMENNQQMLQGKIINKCYKAK